MAGSILPLDKTITIDHLQSRLLEIGQDVYYLGSTQSQPAMVMSWMRQHF
jgi:hypothetical protein